MKAIRRLGKSPMELGTSDKGCDGGTCPDILEAENGDFIVIGKDITSSVDLAGIVSVGPGEKAILIPRITLLSAKQGIPETIE